MPSLGAKKEQWVIFNVGQVGTSFVLLRNPFKIRLLPCLYSGYYRVAYDETNLGLIIQQLIGNHTAIPSKNRAQLLDDALNVARANQLPYAKALDMTKYLKFERDYAPWTAAVNNLDFIDIMLYGHADFNDWIVRKNYPENISSNMTARNNRNQIVGLYEWLGDIPLPICWIR